MALNERYFVGEFILGLDDNMYNERVHNRYCRRRRYVCAIFQACCAIFCQWTRKYCFLHFAVKIDIKDG